MNPSQPDYYAKPVFALYAWLGGEGSRANYEPYDVMHITDHEWELWVAWSSALHALDSLFSLSVG